MDLSKHLEAAADAVKRRNYASAVQRYGQLLAIQPDHLEARAGLRNALFQKAAQKAPSRAAAMVFGGIHLLVGGLCGLLGKPAAAAASFERYLAKDPLHEGVNLKLARALRKAGFNKSALAVYKAYAEHQPRCVEASRNAGELLYAAGDINGALTMYEQALKVDPRDQEALKARKNLAAEGALSTTGIETASSSRELIKDKEAQKKLEKKARIQLSKEELAAELDELEEQLMEKPDDRKLLMKVGRYRQMDKDLQGALDCYERALELDGSDAELADTCADLRLKLQEQRVEDARKRGDDAAAERAGRALQEARAVEFQRRVERQPTDLKLRFELGKALVAIGRHDDAIAELQQAVKDPRSKAEAHLHLADAFAGKDLQDLAYGQLEKALDAAQGSEVKKEIRYRIGVLCEAMDRADEALQHFTSILEQDIGFRDVREKVDRLRAG